MLVINKIKVEAEFIKKFINIISDPKLINEAILVGGSLRCGLLKDYFLHSNAAYVTLEGLESVGLIDKNGAFKVDHPIATKLKLSIDKRAFDQVQDLFGNSHSFTPSQCIILAACFQEATNQMNESADLYQLRANIMSIMDDDMEKGMLLNKLLQTFSFDAFKHISSLIFFKGNQLSPTSHKDLLQVVETLEAKAKSYVGQTVDDSSFEQDTQQRPMVYSAALQADDIRGLIPLITKDVSSLIPKENLEHQSKLVLYALKHRILHLSFQKGWNTGFQLFSAQANSGTQITNVPYSINSQLMLVEQGLSAQITPFEAVKKISDLASQYENSWYRYCRSFVINPSPYVSNFQKLLSTSLNQRSDDKSVTQVMKNITLFVKNPDKKFDVNKDDVLDENDDPNKKISN